MIEIKFRISYLILMFIPILTALLLYSKIFHVAKIQIESIAKTQGGPTEIPRGRYLKMIFVMAGLYMLFYIPSGIFLLLLVHLEEVLFGLYLYDTTLVSITCQEHSILTVRELHR